MRSHGGIASASRSGEPGPETHRVSLGDATFVLRSAPDCAAASSLMEGTIRCGSDTHLDFIRDPNVAATCA
jgi:hypothetical protein